MISNVRDLSLAVFARVSEAATARNKDKLICGALRYFGESRHETTSGKHREQQKKEALCASFFVATKSAAAKWSK